MTSSQWRAHISPKCGEAINLSTTFYLRQEDDQHVHGFGVLAGPTQGGLGYIKAALLLPFFHVALRQDRRILTATHHNKAFWPDASPVVGRLDILRSDIDAILRGERPKAADAPVELTMEL